MMNMNQVFRSRGVPCDMIHVATQPTINANANECVSPLWPSISLYRISKAKPTTSISGSIAQRIDKTQKRIGKRPAVNTFPIATAAIPCEMIVGILIAQPQHQVSLRRERDVYSTRICLKAFRGSAAPCAERLRLSGNALFV